MPLKKERGREWCQVNYFFFLIESADDFQQVGKAIFLS